MNSGAIFIFKRKNQSTHSSFTPGLCLLPQVGFDVFSVRHFDEILGIHVGFTYIDIGGKGGGGEQT